MTCYGFRRGRVRQVTPRDPGGFNAFVPHRMEAGAASCRPHSGWPLGRRSGRVPALPYPPPRSQLKVRMPFVTSRSCR
jgi:hypothetical protein